MFHCMYMFVNFIQVRTRQSQVKAHVEDGDASLGEPPLFAMMKNSSTTCIHAVLQL